MRRDHLLFTALAALSGLPPKSPSVLIVDDLHPTVPPLPDMDSTGPYVIDIPTAKIAEVQSPADLQCIEEARLRQERKAAKRKQHNERQAHGS